MINKSLKKKIHKLAKKDQLMRKKEGFDIKIDIQNTEELKNIINRYGWPDNNLVGKKASHEAWLIAQHADHDLNFQKNCLKIINKKVKKNLVDKKDLAYLTDRILVNQGKPQLYGTQFYVNKDKKFIHRPIRDKKIWIQEDKNSIWKNFHNIKNDY